ncbi:TPA: hypothetical protein DEG21_02665 [Patescibacteria group bacterium]|nr:hypothetical protein [Candidatus Gracilibacteria bacterium]HBY74777.1 hypothetical protein [Candidatus Gracilibacteria bacterium]
MRFNSFFTSRLFTKKSLRHKLSKSASCIIFSSLFFAGEKTIVASIIFSILFILSSLKPTPSRYFLAILAPIISF